MTEWKVGDRFQVTSNPSDVNPLFCGCIGTVTKLENRSETLLGFMGTFDENSLPRTTSATATRTFWMANSMVFPLVVPETIDEVEAFLNG